MLLASMFGDARAQCVTVHLANEARTSTHLAARCNDAILRMGPEVRCRLTSPPACAQTFTANALALAYGPDNPPRNQAGDPALSAQRRCQARIGRVAADLVPMLVYAGPRRHSRKVRARVERALDGLVDDCAVTVAQDPATDVILPTVGSQCAPAVGRVGSLVDVVRLRTCLLSLLTAPAGQLTADPAALRPNIVLILTDDQRWDSTGGEQAPSGSLTMPNTIAELAGSGVTFTNAYVTTPLCAPSRSSILTGSYAHRTGVYTNGGTDVFDDSSTVAVWLQRAGYRTGLIGKYMNRYSKLWASRSSPYIPPGWTEWNGMPRVAYYDYEIVEPDGHGGYLTRQYGDAASDYLTDVLREKAKDFITRAVAAQQPFFLYLAFKAPHAPWIPAPRHAGVFDALPPWRPPSYDEADVSDKPTWLREMPLLTPPQQAHIDRIRVRQLETLQAVDEAIGGSTRFGIVGIMEHLRTLGVADNTVVIFMSDNGLYWGEHRLQKKRDPYDEDIRTPLLVWFPKLAPRRRVEGRIVLNIDIAPTLAELAGIDPPIAHDGESFLHLIDGTARNWRTDFLTEGWPRGHSWATVNQWPWKYTETPVTPGSVSSAVEMELYDLRADPYELTNVASDPANAARVSAMAVRLRELRPGWPLDADSNLPDPSD
jgi:arylsulfatase A-like enzyme